MPHAPGCAATKIANNRAPVTVLRRADVLAEPLTCKDRKPTDESVSETVCRQTRYHPLGSCPRPQGGPFCSTRHAEELRDRDRISAVSLALRLAGRRAARAGRAAQLPRPPDARVDEVLGDGATSRHRPRGELGPRCSAQFKWVYAFLSPVGGYLADRFSRRLTICGSLFVWSAVTWWTGHVDDLRRAARGALADGDQRGVLHPGGAGADRRLPHRADALAGRRPAPDGASTAA